MGESQEGPGAVVRPTELMCDKLEAWLDVIMQCAGAFSTVAFTMQAAEILRSAHDLYVVISDAAGDGKGEPGIEGNRGCSYHPPASQSCTLLLGRC